MILCSGLRHQGTAAGSLREQEHAPEASQARGPRRGQPAGGPGEASRPGPRETSGDPVRRMSLFIRPDYHVSLMRPREGSYRRLLLLPHTRSSKYEPLLKLFLFFHATWPLNPWAISITVYGAERIWRCSEGGHWIPTDLGWVTQPGFSVVVVGQAGENSPSTKPSVRLLCYWSC